MARFRFPPRPFRDWSLRRKVVTALLLTIVVLFWPVFAYLVPPATEASPEVVTITDYRADFKVASAWSSASLERFSRFGSALTCARSARRPRAAASSRNGSGKRDVISYSTLWL